MVMSMPTSSPFSFSKCQGALVLPVPTISLPRSSTVRSVLPLGACAAACSGARAAAVAPTRPATASPVVPSVRNSLRACSCSTVSSVRYHPSRSGVFAGGTRPTAPFEPSALPAACPVYWTSIQHIGLDDNRTGCGAARAFQSASRCVVRHGPGGSVWTCCGEDRPAGAGSTGSWNCSTSCTGTGGRSRIGELARRLNAPRSSTYEIVRTLAEAALLETGADGRVFFGKSLYFYGVDYLREHDLVRRGRDEVDRLARETGETSQFCMLHENKYTVVHMRAGRTPLPHQLGHRHPDPAPLDGIGPAAAVPSRAAGDPGRSSGPRIWSSERDVIAIEDFVASVAEPDGTATA